MAGPADAPAAVAAGRGHLRASHDDREQMIDTLKVAFVQGRLTKDEFDARIGQTLSSRTYAELAAVTADLPAGLAPAGLAAAQPPQQRPGNVVRWGASGFITPAILAAAYAFASLRVAGAFAAMAFVVACGYFVFWLSVGANLLWEWHCMMLPSAGMCVRCAHSAAAHRAPATCTVRPGSLNRCRCTGYVPPGRLPQAEDQRRLAAGTPAPLT